MTSSIQRYIYFILACSVSYKLAMGQMLVEGGCPEANLERAAAMIEAAGRAGCEIVVLPECLDLGWTDPSARDIAEPIPGRYSDVLSRAASDSALYVTAGLTERTGSRVYNAAVLIAPNGEIVLKHRKINELTIAQDLYSVGDRLSVVETPYGIAGITICADNFPDSLVLAHALARMGCQILLSPCAWAVEANHDNSLEPYGALWRGAYETLTGLYDLTVAGVSNVGWLRGGPWMGRKCIGCSLAVGPGGRVLAQGPYGESAESLIVVDVP